MRGLPTPKGDVENFSLKKEVQQSIKPNGTNNFEVVMVTCELKTQNPKRPKPTKRPLTKVKRLWIRPLVWQGWNCIT